MLLVEPQTHTALPSTRAEWLDRHLARVCILSELTPSQYQNAEEKYHAVGDWLAATGSSLAIFAPEVYPQGSMLLGTTVRPFGQNEYDLDLVCQLHWCAQQPPLTIYDWVHRRIAANETYQEMLEKSRPDFVHLFLGQETRRAARLRSRWSELRRLSRFDKFGRCG